MIKPNRPSLLFAATASEYPNGSDSEYTVAPTAIDFLQKRPFVYAKAFIVMAIRPCAKSDRCTGDGNSDWSSGAAFRAPKFQLDDTPTPVLLVRPTQGFGAVVRFKYQPQTFDQQTSRDRAHRGRRQQNPLSAEILGPGVYFA